MSQRLRYFVVNASAFATIAPVLLAQKFTRANVATTLGFETLNSKGSPAGWSMPTNASVDRVVHYEGTQSVRIERDASSSYTFTPISLSIPIDFAGKEIELRGYLRVKDVTGKTALWLREDNETTAVAMDNGEREEFGGTQDWKQFSLTLPINDDAKSIVLGALLLGTGTAWVDKLELFVDGKPIADAPAHVSTALETDGEFAKGSHIQFASLSDVQVENLATLGEVWGYLKYHHPLVMAGKRNWDAELFRQIPVMLALQTRAELDAQLLQWIRSLGPVPACHPCATSPKTGVQTPADLGWMHDRKRFSPELIVALNNIYRNRSMGVQFFVERNFNNQVKFIHEPTYGGVKFPDQGYQLLALFRWYNDLEYWYPYRATLPDLHKMLRSYVRPIGLVSDEKQFKLEMLKLIGEARDTHANLWGAIAEVRPPVGSCRVSVALRYIGDQPVVWAVSSEDSRLKIGDELTAIDGQSVEALRQEWSPYYSDSNEAARKRDIAGHMLQGECGAVPLNVIRRGQPLEIASQRETPTEKNASDPWHARAGDAFQLLSKDVAYIKPSSAKFDDEDQYIEQAKGTKGIIIDIRDYPTAFMPFRFGGHLMEHETHFAHITEPDFDNPGTFIFTKDDAIKPETPHYPGRIVILVDEKTQSSAEYTAMALRQAPGAVVIGSQTAGADGNVTGGVPLTFGMQAEFSGLGIFTPEDAPTQRIGIVPDVETSPTTSGIAAGRDEVLEAGIRAILGGSAAESEIEAMAHK